MIKINNIGSLKTPSDDEIHLTFEHFFASQNEYRSNVERLQERLDSVSKWLRGKAALPPNLQQKWSK